jgi:Sec-independent protein translocase protein TatA
VVLNLDPAKLAVILVLAMVVMGPEKMQSSARHFGAMWRSVSEFREKAEQQVRDALPDLDLPRIPTSPRAVVTSYVTDLFSSSSPVSSESPSHVVAVASPGGGERADASEELTRRVATSNPARPPEDDVSMN